MGRSHFGRRVYNKQCNARSEQLQSALDIIGAFQKQQIVKQWNNMKYLREYVLCQYVITKLRWSHVMYLE